MTSIFYSKKTEEYRAVSSINTDMQLVNTGFLVSIIVPVYNVERYLTNCVKSLVSQSYRHIEIILINDGSNDDSLKICKEWSIKDPRIVVLDQENSGVSSARNAGISIAKGDYVLFVDSDDTIAEDAVEILLKCAIEDDTEIVMARHKKVFAESIFLFDTKIKEKKVINIQEALYRITCLDYEAGVNSVAKLYRAAIVKKHCYKEGYPLGEDQAFVFEVMKECTRITYLDCEIYNYLIRDSSVMHSVFSKTKSEKLRKIYDMILNEYSDERVYTRLLVFRIFQCELTIINNMYRESIEDQEYLDRLIKYLRGSLLSVMRSDYPIWKRMQCFILVFFPRIYRKIILRKIK